MATDFTMHQGETKTLNFTITDAAGDAVALAGASATWKMALNPNIPADSETLKKTSADAEITFADNVATVAIDPEDTATVAPGVYYHELRITDAVATVESPTTGYLVIIESVI